MQNAVLREKRRGFFYGWWMVVAGMMGEVLNAGLYRYGFSVFFLPLQETFQVSRAALSGAFSLERLESGLLGPVEGYLIDRFGPRRVMLVGTTLMGTGFILLSRVTSLFQFYLVFVLCIALGASLSLITPIVTALNNWFIKKRGLAVGIAQSGMGLGGLLIPVLAWLVATYGWRSAAVVAGLIVWGIGFPIALVMRQRPEQHGYLPDGATPSTIERAAEHKKEVNFTARQALQTSAFWLLGFAFSLRLMVTGALAIHLIPFLTDKGMSLGLAAVALGSLAVISVVGRLGYGWLGDTFGRRNMVVVAFATMMLSLLVISVATALWHILVFLVLYAPSYGGLANLWHGLRADYFGRTSYATIHGFMGIITMVGTMVGPLFAGYVYDTTGSYRFAFIVFAMATVVAMVLVLLARRPTLSKS